jgi:release factor glutamine methyltransferase
VRVVALPGVYRPRSDTQLLMRSLFTGAHALKSRAVLDLCTGTGALAVAAARAGADVLAVDLSRRAVLNARLNARLNRVRIRAVDGDLWEPVRSRRFDVIVANPPYLPAPEPEARPGRASRAWDAGKDGRALLDPICREAVHHLRPGGKLLLIQSSLADPTASEVTLAETGLNTRVVARHDGGLGPIAAGRVEWLREEGRVCAEGRESLVVIEAQMPMHADAPRTSAGRLTSGAPVPGPAFP